MPAGTHRASVPPKRRPRARKSATIAIATTMTTTTTSSNSNRNAGCNSAKRSSGASGSSRSTGGSGGTSSRSFRDRSRWRRDGTTRGWPWRGEPLWRSRRGTTRVRMRTRTRMHAGANTGTVVATVVAAELPAAQWTEPTTSATTTTTTPPPATTTPTKPTTSGDLPWSAGTTRWRSTGPCWGNPTSGWPTFRTTEGSPWESCGCTGRHSGPWERHWRPASGGGAGTSPRARTVRRPMRPLPPPTRSFRPCTTLPTSTATRANRTGPWRPWWRRGDCCCECHRRDETPTPAAAAPSGCGSIATTAGTNRPASLPPLATSTANCGPGETLGMPTWKPCRSTKNSRGPCRPRYPRNSHHRGAPTGTVTAAAATATNTGFAVASTTTKHDNNNTETNGIS
mmetsp:Transcript_4526/g.9861  ORF Transcript_4526/g.9861 Transcript_4526/m.9861 type:complete len:397 (-) Transcript_4526:654-1844(-)